MLMAHRGSVEGCSIREYPYRWIACPYDDRRFSHVRVAGVRARKARADAFSANPSVGAIVPAK